MDKMFNAIMEMAIPATVIKAVDLVEEMPANVVGSGRKPVSRADRRRATKMAEHRREQMLHDAHRKAASKAPKGRTKTFIEKEGFHGDKICLYGRRAEKRVPLPFSSADVLDDESEDTEIRFWFAQEGITSSDIAEAFDEAMNHHYVVVNKSYRGFSLSPMAEALFEELLPTAADLYKYFFPYDRGGRDDLALVVVILLLGEKANGDGADLRLVEIPVGEEFRIYEDYEGIETVEKPRVIFG